MSDSREKIHPDDLPHEPAAAAKYILSFVERDGQMTYPVQLANLAKALGIAVYKANFANSDVSGFAILNPTQLPEGVTPGVNGTIFVNASHAATRQNFTVAHEIGHLVLRHFGDSALPGRTVYRAVGMPYDSSKENQANHFAANLLMPEAEFKRIFKIYNDDPDLTSVYFGVSPKAVMYRSKDLGLLDDQGKVSSWMDAAPF